MANRPTKLTFTRPGGPDSLPIPQNTTPHEFLSGIIKGGGYWIQQGEEQVFVPWAEVKGVVAA